MNTPSTTLALATNSIKPPAKKSEIVEAMAQRQHAKMQKIQQDAHAAYVAVTEKFNGMISEYVQKHGTAERDPWAYDNDGNLYEIGVRLTFKGEMPRGIIAAKKRSDEFKKAWRDAFVPELSTIRAQLRAKMHQHTPPGQRIAALLSNKATVKALDATLAALEQQAQPQITA